MSDTTMATAGEHMPQEHDVCRDFQSFLDNAVVGLDAFSDLTRIFQLVQNLELLCDFRVGLP